MVQKHLKFYCSQIFVHFLKVYYVVRDALINIEEIYTAGTLGL